MCNAYVYNLNLLEPSIQCLNSSPRLLNVNRCYLNHEHYLDGHTVRIYL